MKKYISAIIMAVLTGGFFAYLTFKNPDEDKLVTALDSRKITVFQLGVFASEENANNFGDNNPSSIVTKEGDMYKVYSALYGDEQLIQKLEEYYKSNNIEYILKDFIVTDDEYEEINAYEKLMLESNDNEVMFKTNQIILDKFVGD